MRSRAPQGRKEKPLPPWGLEKPAAEEENTAEGETESPVKSSSDIVMLFAGDVYFSDHVLRAYDSAGESTACWTREYGRRLRRRISSW